MIIDFKIFESMIFEDLITPEESYTSFIALKKYKGNKNTYIHFTDINKLGMNPQKDHHDPYGIYFYPTNFVFSDDTKFCQYGFSMKYYYICKINTKNFLNINKVDYDDIKLFFKKAGLIDLFYNINIGDFGKQGQRYDKKLWNVLDMLNTEPSKRDDYFETDEGKTIRKDSREYLKTLPQVKWNTFFSKLGYDGIIDNKGVVNDNEPQQLIVFNPKTIEILETGENKIQKNVYNDLFNELKNSLNCDEFIGEYKTKNGITLYTAKTKKDDKYVNIEINFDRNKVIFYYVKDGLIKTQKTEFNLFGVYRQSLMGTMQYYYNSSLKEADINKKIQDFSDDKFTIILNKIFKYIQPENISYDKDTSSYYSRYGYMKLIYSKSDDKFEFEYCPLQNNYDVCMKFEFKNLDEFKEKLNEWFDSQTKPDDMREYLKKYSLFNKEII